MRFFFISFLIMTALGAAFYVIDGPGSGAGIFAIICAVLAVGVGAYNYVRFGSIFKDGKR
ncbi:hypothetical protein BEN47_06235 [Hymenobacter lapidarius]|uniref:Uncharacterized protein n=1 Tax=Hymenobacter lapidarius TaxID=1908237 RepID=A0A1G1SQG0_9BACT|nr:hypothetical protein [Hymenobacter lapidarius]OGX80853.1 hypothetical protein BEN47_06235 [Hymenobacter lapidarius]